MGEVTVFIFLGLMSDLDLIRELEELIGEKLQEVDEERFQFDSTRFLEEEDISLIIIRTHYFTIVTLSLLLLLFVETLRMN
jgi:hypothetical protein